MMESLREILAQIEALLRSLSSPSGVLVAALKFIPFVLFFELPFTLLVMLGLARFWIRRNLTKRPVSDPYYPGVSCVVTCYNEGEAVIEAIKALVMQRYPGPIEILAIVDGATQNAATWRAIQTAEKAFADVPLRVIRAIPKWQRGGRVSSSNTGMTLARYDILVSLDGDTTLENDAIYHLAQHFHDEAVVAVGCSLRVRNAMLTPLTAMQAIEYMVSIRSTRVGLAEWGALNNISGAFGAFRKSFLQQIGGWNTGTAEDMDLTMRIRSYCGRYPKTKLAFEPMAVGRTEVPHTLKGFLRQRLRWDGDLYFIYMRNHWRNVLPRMMGWMNVLTLCWTGLFFQMLMPFAITAYTIYLFAMYPAITVLGVLGLVYAFYLLLAGITFGQYLLMISESPLNDALYVFLLPLYPFYTFLCRCWGVFAILGEMFLKTHLDSSMAPWWVLKRNKF